MGFQVAPGVPSAARVHSIADLSPIRAAPVAARGRRARDRSRHRPPLGCDAAGRGGDRRSAGRPVHRTETPRVPRNPAPSSAGGAAAVRTRAPHRHRAALRFHRPFPLLAPPPARAVFRPPFLPALAIPDLPQGAQHDGHDSRGHAEREDQHVAVQFGLSGRSSNSARATAVSASSSFSSGRASAIVRQRVRASSNFHVSLRVRHSPHHGFNSRLANFTAISSRRRCRDLPG